MLTNLWSRRVRAVALALVAAGALAMAGCTIDRGAASASSEGQDAQLNAAAEEQLAPVASIEDGQADVDPTQKITVKSLGEGLNEVTMTNEAGGEVEAAYSGDRKVWEVTEPLGYGRTYTIEAVDNNGMQSTTVFTTMAPQATVSVALSPLEGSTVGIGQTIGFRFSQAITDRQAAQDALTVTTEPAVEGAFYWISAQEVRWRPAEYWTPGTTVTVEANIYGKDLGDGVYGTSDNSTSFSIGDDVRTVVDDATKTMTVYRNGEVLRTIPVSLGRDTADFATPNGIYIVGDQYDDLVMDSTTFGLAYDDGGYRTKVKYATQLSYSGIYVHGAPWSAWAQGNTNQSHGCVNVTDEAAQWYMNTVKRGDIVEIKNTVGGTLSGVDGLGDWNIPWSTWSAGNADQ